MSVFMINKSCGKRGFHVYLVIFCPSPGSIFRRGRSQKSGTALLQRGTHAFS